METNETLNFLLNCLGLNIEFVDKLFSSFDIEMEDNEVAELLDSCHEEKDYSQFGNKLILFVFNTVVETYSDKLDSSKFNCVVDNYCSELFYDGEKITSNQDLEKIINKRDEQ